MVDAASELESMGREGDLHDAAAGYTRLERVLERLNDALASLV